VNDQVAFVRAICESPGDDAPRLVFADWLDDHEESGWAELVRLQCAWAIAWQCVPECVCRAAEDKFHCSHCLTWERTAPLLDRERELWRDYYPQSLAPIEPGWSVFPGSWAFKRHYTPAGSLAIVRRGLVDEVRLTTNLFLRNAAALFAAHPITEVRLTDREPAVDEGRGIWYAESDRAHELATVPKVLIPHMNAEVKQNQKAFALGNMAVFPSEATATAALSHACVSYARKLVGLPELGTHVEVPIR
jgi:uncharacterized protein (TIGR02996 family)